MRPLIKWGIACILGLFIVICILALFKLFAVPIRSELTNYFADYFSEKLEGTIVEGSFDIKHDSREEWVSPLTELLHCEFNISGKITENNGVPIENAEIKIYNTGIFDSGDYRFTNRDGRFSYTEIGVETCQKENFYLSISKNGYEPHFMLAEPDEEINISLAAFSLY